MASLGYLWNHRASFTFGSKAFIKVWAKRVLSFPELLKRNHRRLKLLRKGAKIHTTAEIGDVSIVGPKNNLTIGSYTFLGKVYIALHEQVTIAERVCINDGVEILTASHDIMDPKWKHIKKKVIIEDYVWIGTGAMILPGVKIGRGAVIGARAVVSKSVESGMVVVGNPARVIDKNRCVELDYNPCEFLAANRAWLIG